MRERGATLCALDGVSDEPVDLRIVGQALPGEFETSEDSH
jgi:hypothetical protein